MVDMVEARLTEREVVPFWTLPDKHGQPFNLAKQRGRTHWVLLVCGASCDPAPWLEQLAPHMNALRTLPAQAIVVVASEDAAGALPTLPVTIVIDATGKVHDRYVPAGAVAGLYILDRYGTLYHQWLVRDVAELPPVHDVVSWIEAVGMQCSV